MQDIVLLTVPMGKAWTVLKMINYTCIYIYICFSGWKEGVLSLFQRIDPNLYRVTTYCDTTSFLRTRVPETRVLGELSKSSCSVTLPMNLDVIDSGVILSALPDGLCLVKAADSQTSSSCRRTSGHSQPQSHRASFQAAFPEALISRHTLECCLETWT